MSESLSRLRLPFLLLSLALLVGGSKLDALRPVEGQVVAFVVPAFAVLSAIAPFGEARPGLRNAVFGLGAVVLALTELGSYRVVVENQVHSPGPVLGALFVVALVLALLLEVAGAQRGLHARITGWLGLALLFGWYFPGHADLANLFGSVFAAFLISFLLGGGGGLCLGELAVRRARG